MACHFMTSLGEAGQCYREITTVVRNIRDEVGEMRTVRQGSVPPRPQLGAEIGVSERAR